MQRDQSPQASAIMVECPSHSWSWIKRISIACCSEAQDESTLARLFFFLILVLKHACNCKVFIYSSVVFVCYNESGYTGTIEGFLLFPLSPAKIFAIVILNSQTTEELLEAHESHLEILTDIIYFIG
jgi:hypothetical protein